MAEVTEFQRSRELFLNLTRREVNGKYKRTALGQLWSLANPLALMAIYTFVFSFVFRIQIPPGINSGLTFFALWLLCGLLPWLFFSNVVKDAMASMIENESLIKKVYFPRSVLVFAKSAALGVSFTTEMGVLLVILTIAGATGVMLWIPGVLLFMVLLAIFATGIALVLAVLNVFFRDTEYIVGIMLQFGMYLSPVIYPVAMVAGESEKYGSLFWNVTVLDIYQLNPMVSFLDAFRAMLYDNVMPDASTFIICAVSALVSITIGWFVFRRHAPYLAEVL